MKHELLVAGFGGQGVLSMGMTLAYAGMVEGKQISWMPSYGPEMRGGTANCIVIVADAKVSSPILTMFDTVIALNQPSLDKFEHAVKPGGLLIFESTNMITAPTRTDITLLPVAAALEAAKLKKREDDEHDRPRCVPRQDACGGDQRRHGGAQKVLPERYHNLLPLNEQALRRGMELSRRPVPA